MLTTAVIAFLGGLIPVLGWLWFWEHEDKHPEPHKLTAYALLAGMASVLIVLPLEIWVVGNFEGTIVIFLLWAAIEEIVKYVIAYVVVLRRAENDEPIDSVMYMITVALGFAALENALFIFNPLLQSNFSEAISTGNFRFIGATVLHIVASSVIGICLALSFYKPKKSQRRYLVLGLFLAIVLHSCFNLSIILFDGKTAILSFFAVWIGIVSLLFLFEKIKRIKKPLN